MTGFGLNQTLPYYGAQGLLASNTQGNPAFVGLPEMSTEATTAWLMNGLTGNPNPSIRPVTRPTSAAYQGVPWGDAPLVDGPKQWASTVTSANTARQVPTSSQPSKVPASDKQTVSGEKPAKIPQWAWEATQTISDPVARIAIAHLLSKECDPKDIHKVVNHPNDPGGTTKYGIAQRYHPDQDVANLTIQDAVKIYYNEYWSPNRDLLNSLPSDGMRIATLDAFAHHGVEGTKKLLKKIEKHLTPETLGEARLAELSAKDHADSFMKGWKPRIKEVTSFANSMY